MVRIMITAAAIAALFLGVTGGCGKEPRANETTDAYLHCGPRVCHVVGITNVGAPPLEVLIQAAIDKMCPATPVAVTADAGGERGWTTGYVVTCN